MSLIFQKCILTLFALLFFPNSFCLTTWGPQCHIKYIKDLYFVQKCLRETQKKQKQKENPKHHKNITF